MGIVRWISEWWTTWRVLRELDEEGRAILLGDVTIWPDDFIEVERPT